MTQTIVNLSLTVRNKPKKHYQEEDFSLGIVGWCPCSDFASFSFESNPCLQEQDSLNISMETCYRKGLKRKQTRDLKGKTEQSCSERWSKHNSVIIEDISVCGVDDIDKVEMEREMEAEKENISDQFSFDTTLDELEKLMEGACPVSTAKNNEWVYNNFESWRTARNKRFSKTQCPDDVFSSKEVACEWLCKYITETRKGDGSEYTPHSLYLLLAGIQRYVRKLYPKMEFNLFSDHEFKSIKNLCDSLFRKLHSKGIGTSLKVTLQMTKRSYGTEKY